LANGDAVIQSADALNARWRESVAAERLGDLKTAEAGYRAILQAAPSHAPALRRLALIGQRYGDQDAAAKLLERAITAAPDYWPAKLDLADIRQQTGAFDAAAALYADGLAKADPVDPARLSNYAAVLLKLGRYQDVLEIADRHRESGVTSANVSAYRAQALWELGRDDDALELADPNEFVFERRPEPPAGFASIAAFNEALITAFEVHPTLTDNWNPTQRAARGGRVTENVFAADLKQPAPIQAFRQMLEREVTALAADLPTTLGHPFQGRRPKQPFEIISWANLMPAQGVQAAHIHNLGWLSGVYYPKLPKALGDATDHAGWLGVGRPGYGIEARRAPALRFLKPEEGLLVCFPSYLWHWTEPFQGNEERVSVAFDVA
jgi:uncharacterized protein (TIGR02466 family)